MLKRFLYLILLASIFYNNYAYWLTIPSNRSTTILQWLNSNNSGWIIILDNWNNYINDNNNSSLDKVQFFSTDNQAISNWSQNNISNYWSQITITCKNWYITKISNSLHVRSWLVKSAILSYDYNNHTYNSTVTLKCKEVNKPWKKILSKDLNYETINTNTNNIFWWWFSISKINFKIKKSDILSRLVSWKEPNNQPTFTDILFLQIKIISSLIDNITFSKNIEIKDLFKNYNTYTWRINKLKAFKNKKDFEDSFTWSITLKDIWIGWEIIKWLFNCINNNNCSNINFKNPSNKYNVYSLNEIFNTLYAWQNNIIDESIKYFWKIKNTCNNINISNQSIKDQVSSLCNYLLSTNISNIQMWQMYKIWTAWASIRKSNLETIKNNIPSWWLNLKWIYNVYRELNNLLLWLKKIEIIKRIKSTNNKYHQQLEYLKILLWTDLDEINSHKINSVVWLVDNIKKIIDNIESSVAANSNIFNTIFSMFTNNSSSSSWKTVSNNYKLLTWLNLWNNFKIELKVNWSSLIRTGWPYYLFRKNNWKIISLYLDNNNLNLKEYSNNNAISHPITFLWDINNNCNKKSPCLTINKDMFYIISFSALNWNPINIDISNSSWTIKSSQISLNKKLLQLNDLYIWSNNDKTYQWNDTLYYKISKN